MPFISYAQNFEDVILYRALKGVTEGFYIDVGAHHPQEYSVTQAFYQRGWRGINIEPVPASFALLQAARRRDTNLKIAASNQAGTAQLFVTPDSSLSTFQPRQALRGRSMEVDTLTLNQVLLEHPLPAIHFLKIDVEGAEKAVLEGINLDLHRPWIILVEAVKPTTSIPDHHAWEPLITAHRYDYVYFDGINRFYLAQEHRHLRDAFALPPNFSDHFISAELAAARYQPIQWLWGRVVARLRRGLRKLLHR